MKVRLKILLCLLVVAAAVVAFWPRPASSPVAMANGSAASAPAVVAGAAASSAKSVVAEDLGSLSAASTNRLAFRLANTTQSIAELKNERHAILLENAFIDTTAKVDLKIPAHLKAAGEPGAYLVQARGAVDAAFRAAIGAAGGKIISYIPNNAFLVQLAGADAAVLAANSRVQAVLPYEPYYKISATLLGRAVNEKPLPGGTYLTLGLFARGADATLAQLKKMGAEILTQERSPFGPMVRVRPPADWIALAQLPGVQRVEAAYRRRIANDLARPAVGVTANSTTTTNYLGLTEIGRAHV